MSRAYLASGFSGPKEYVAALRHLPKILTTRSFAPLMPADAVKESGHAMRHCLVSRAPRQPVAEGRATPRELRRQLTRARARPLPRPQ